MIWSLGFSAHSLFSVLPQRSDSLGRHSINPASTWHPPHINGVYRRWCGRAKTSGISEIHFNRSVRGKQHEAEARGEEREDFEKFVKESKDE